MAKDQELYDAEIDDLFGGPDVSEQQFDPALNNVNSLDSYLPLPMPMPMPMPMPGPSADVSDIKTNQNDQVQEAAQHDSVVPGGTGDQWQDILKAMQDSTEDAKQADLSLFFQQFMAQQAVPVAPPASSLYKACQVALPTQFEPKANPPPAGAKISHSQNKKSGNRIDHYDWYDTFPVREKWVAHDGNRQIPIKYSKHGNLRLPKTLNTKALVAYIRGCSERGIPLRLWVQNIPTIHKERFPGHENKEERRCIAEDCPVKTLSRGDFQVCLDEYPTETSNGRFDPFFAAGYIHLFCIEEKMSLGHLMQFADVQPDVRELPLESRNPMSLLRDSKREIEEAFYEWKNKHHTSFATAGMPIPESPSTMDSDCLYYSLTKKKLETQPKTRQKMRDKRNGNDISKDFGNLRRRMANKEAAKRKRKRDRFSSDNSSVVELGEPFVPAPGPSSKRQRIASSAYTRPALQTAAAYALQAQPSSSACAPSPLRRSRRLSGGHVVSNITIPTTSAYAAAYGNTVFTPAPGTASSARHGRRSLNVRTDNMSLALNNVNFSPSIDGMAYNFKNVCDQYMVENLGFANATFNPAATNAHYLHFGNVTTPSGTYGVITAPVPYELRPTPARCETAIRQTSARISMTEGIRCDEKRLIEAVKSPGILLKTPVASYQASQTLRSASQLRQGSQVDAVASPGDRRMTRSMSRNVSAVELPFDQGLNFQLELMYPQDLGDFDEGFFNLDGFS